jgi:hypothetical protein
MMEAPPFSGDPYDFVDQTASNAGLQGVQVAWDGIRYFWGTVVNEAVADIQAALGEGGILV